MEFKLLDGMMIGVSSAAAQIEGGNVDHNWNAWADAGHIKDGTSPRRADDHFRRWKEDIDLMHAMGLQIYRLGVEWARLEPEEGKFDEAAAGAYRELLSYINSLGIKPLVTLHHFANPMWFERRGAFETPENGKLFLRFVEYAIRTFGDLAEDYITINEPNVYAMQGYFGGGFPPGKNSVGKMMRVLSVMCGCHIEAYERIHAMRREMGFANTAVGFAHHMRAFQPKNAANPVHALSAKLSRRLFQGIVSDACLLGDFHWPLKNVYGAARGEYADFLGLNYYTRSTVTLPGDGVAAGAPLNDLGWEIYPAGIVECAKEQHDVLARPIYVTENGTCDNADAFRARYLAEHWQAMSMSGLPFARYYHWCFTDNFEWLEGESARFGLVHVDYESQQRTVKQSGNFVTDVIQNGGVTKEIYEKYVAAQRYHR